MNNKKYIDRILDKKVEEYLEIFGAVVIEGPKYCGKTWMGSKHANSEILLSQTTAEGSNNIEIAKISPSVILEGDKPRLIDEWQEATNLWDEIRNEVDKTGDKGQFILTGSSTPNRDKIIHSGAGRFGKINLRTMSLYESGDSSGKVSLKDVIDGKKIAINTGKVKLKKLAELIVRGGWPSNLSLSLKQARVAVKEYVDITIYDDLFRLDGIKRDNAKVGMLLRSLARNESTTSTNSTLRCDMTVIEDVTIDDETLAIYLDAINRLHLLDNDKPFSENIRSSVRVKQAEKRHFCDPSIGCALLNLSPEGLINDLTTMGFYFEALVERDLKIYSDLYGWRNYHYQDYKNREVDHIIEIDDNEWVAIEVKLGANKIEEAACNLVDLKESIIRDKGKPPKAMIVICGLTEYAYQRPDGVYVLPITALKP